MLGSPELSGTKKERCLKTEGFGWRRLQHSGHRKLQSAQAGMRFCVVLPPDLVKTAPHPASATFSEMKFQLESYGIPTANLRFVFSGKGAELPSSLLDAHPNEEGYQLAAREVFTFLLQQPDLGLPTIH